MPIKFGYIAFQTEKLTDRDVLSVRTRRAFSSRFLILHRVRVEFKNVRMRRGHVINLAITQRPFPYIFDFHTFLNSSFQRILKSRLVTTPTASCNYCASNSSLNIPSVQKHLRTKPRVTNIHNCSVTPFSPFLIIFESSEVHFDQYYILSTVELNLD